MTIESALLNGIWMMRFVKILLGLALLLPAVVAGAFVLSRSTGAADEPPHRPGDGTAVLWGDRYFRSPDSLSSWLNDRGATYREWARRHPRAAARHRGATRP